MATISSAASRGATWGTFGGWLIFIAVAANSYGAWVAYMSGSGNIMADFFGQYGLTREMGSLVFFISSALVLYLGLKALGIGEKLTSTGMVLIVCVLIAATLTHADIRIAYLWRSGWQYVVPILNLAVFVFGAQFLVPELVRGNLTTPRRLPWLIILGMVLTFILVAAIPASVIALVGPENLSEVATLSWGRSLGQRAYYTANTFALLAMLTSYWGWVAACSPTSSTISAWAASATGASASWFSPWSPYRPSCSPIPASAASSTPSISPAPSVVC